MLSAGLGIAGTTAAATWEYLGRVENGLTHRSAPVANRVIIAAASSHDAAHLADVLKRERYEAFVCRDAEELAAAIDEHCGVLVLIEDGLDASLAPLERALSALPPWTDVPCVLLQRRRDGAPLEPSNTRLPEAIVNRFVLEHPSRDDALISAVAALMRARQKQFEVHQYVLALSESRQELERKVIKRTAQLEKEMENRLAAEGALRQAQKMEVLGQLTGGVAHDFNNLLTPIVGALDLLRERVRSDLRFDQIAVTGLQAAERARLLIQRLLAFARRQHLQSCAVSVSQLFESANELWSRLLGPTITLEFAVEEGLPSVQADPNQLELALLNLAVNARDAMAGKGTLRVRASARGIQSHPTLNDGAYIAFAIRDEGCGMDAATIQKATEPFFTTKEVGAGTGLGLSMVDGLAAQSGGTLTIDSVPGKGTTVTLLLPASVEEVAAAAEGIEPSTSQSSVSRKVLLVDDEELLRVITAELLTAAGYEVAQAESGEQALDILTHGLAPDLVITDYAMAGMNGAELALEIQRHFSLPVLLTTGYAAIDDANAVRLPQLAKPFRTHELVEAIENVLRSHEASAPMTRETSAGFSSG